MYGITETTVHVTEKTLAAADVEQATSVIGEPLKDLSLQVLDRYGEPVPTGVAGEIYVGGAGVTRGYLGRAALTAQRFVPDPYGPPGVRLYRSGDVARRLPDGGLVYLGRADQQIKLRGFRIELGEIEAVLRAQEGVQDAVVMLDTLAQGDPRLVAYVTGTVEPLALRGGLSRRLPGHMVPALIMPLERFPLTAHGKLDCKALPRPGVVATSGQAPRTDVEKMLARIWAEALHIPEPGIDDNFFSLGGDSINALQVVAKARAAGIAITPKLAMLATTIRKLAAVAGTVKEGADQGSSQPGPLPMLPIVAWFQTLELSEPEHWNQALALELRQPVVVSALARALTVVGQHHDAFRLRLDRGRADGLYLDTAEEPLRLEVCSPQSDEDMDTAIRKTQQGLDLVAGPIARALLIQRERQPDVLLLVAHHIAVDAVSWHILLGDLSTAVTQTMQGVRIELPPVPTNLRHCGEMLLAAADRSDPKPWLAMVAHGYPRLPRNSMETALNTEARLVVEMRELDTQSTTLFLQLVARGSEARASALLCAALWLALGERQLAVTMEHNGRDAEMEADLSRTVGWFTSLYPFCFESSSSQSCPAELLAEMEYALLKLAPHKLDYGLSRWLGSDAGARATLDAAGLPELSLNYLGVVANESQGIFALRPDLILGERAAANTRPFALDLVVVVLKGKLQQRWLFADGLQRPETVAGWADAMQQQLKDLLGSLAAKQLLAADFPLAGLGQHQFDKLVGKRLVTGVYPLSPLQEGILFHSLAETDLRAYHEQVIALLERLDPDMFIRAWRRLLARHDILRSSFHWEALARPLQVVQAKVEQSIEVLDWRCEDEQQRLAEYLEQDSTYGFELSTAPLMRIMFARIGADRWRWVWSYHHILMDGWSLPLLMGELLSIYQGMTTGWETELVPPVQFGSYIAWLVGRSNHDGEAFWRHTLAGLEQPTLVATHQEGEGGSGYHELLITPPPSWEQAVQHATRQVGVSLGSLFQAAWALFLSLSGHGEDVVFGTTMSCRDSGIEGIERMIGLFINTLPLRLCMRPEMSVHDLLRTVQQAQAEVQEHSYDRLVDVQRWSNLDEGEALFDNVLVIENYPAEKPVEDDFGLRLVELFYREHSHYPVTLAVLPDNGLRIKLDYNLAYLGDGAAAVLMQRLVHLVSELAGNLERSIGTFSLLDAEDKQRILHEWNDGVTTAEPANLAQNLFESWAVRQPHAPALLQGENRIDYCQLDQRANVLAQALQQRCVGPERVVAVILPRSPEVVIALLAILKAGGVYLPLDPSYPAELLNYMLRDSQAMLLLSVRAQPLALLEAAPEPLFLDEFDFVASAARVSCPAQQDNLAYLIYTSGSTGQPKPVGVTHVGIANLRRETERALSTNARCRVYMFAPLSFDASVWEVIMALFSGGTLVLADGGPGEDVATALTLAAARHAVTHVLLPPVLLGALSEDALPSVHTLIVGGDVAAPGALARWARSRRVFNAYGPSESTVCVTIEPCTITTVNPPLGRPLGGILIYLLDPWGNPVPPGIPGEIHLGGVGLARGYHRRPALTAESFVPDHLSGIPGARLYRTGDIGRHLPDGRIVYVNRIRGHAKLRGNRINLNGVEQLLRAYPTVRETLAMISVVEERQTLVAYVLTESEFEPTELRAYMAEHVAAFEVPGIIVPLPAWPLTPAGKIDRKALPDPSDSCQQAPHHKSELTPAEAVLLPIWSQLLGRVDLDVHDDYFALGGDSITALHIASRAREQGLGVEPRMVLQQRTIYSLATSAPLLSLGEQEPEHAEVALAPIQHWYFEQELPAIAHWNLSVCLKLQSALEPELLQRALDTLVEIHPALRLRFERAERGWRQSYWSAKPVPLKVLSTGPVEAAAIEAGLHASFDLSEGPLLCAVYRPHGVVGGPELQLIAHHLVVDTWSLRVLVDDFASAYTSLRDRAEIKLLREVESYRRWTERLTSLAADFVPELAYWRAVLATVSEPERLPRKGLVGERRMLVAELDADTSAFLVGEAHQAYRSRGQELLLSALAMAWQHWCGNAQLVVDMETHGREGLPGSEMDLSRSVGWFTALFPVRIEATDDWPKLIDVVKRSLRDIPNGGLGYGVLRYLHAATELRELVAPAISFNYLGRVEAPAVPALGMQLSERETGPTQAKEQPLPHTLGITLLIFAGRLRLSLVYADPAADAAMQELLDHYFAALHALAEHCRGAERGGYQSSDFSGVHLNEAELNALLGDLTEDDE
ncbi:non-ribosomal peptide synthetase [Candidatus Fukatsuia symbiotica]|nr:non-ribosomal peptide synthetase [Candidatus Fukatsuia symbiotica]